MPLITMKVKLVEITPFVPMLSIPHAGGEYVRRHLTALSERFDVTIVGPGTAENIIAARAVDPTSSDVILIPALSPRALQLSKPARLLYKAIFGASLGMDTEFRLKCHPQVRDALKTAEVVGFQWTEAATLSKFVRKTAPQAYQTLVIHDVLAQRWKRSIQRSDTIALKAFYFARYLSALRAERSAFASVDVVIAFSEKDAQLVRDIQPRARVAVIDPPLVDETMPQELTGENMSTKSVLFTGALNRPENHDAIMWFLAEIWPATVALVPEATLTIAGASPRDELKTLAATLANVQVTGFVDDLSEYYSTASVFIAPLRSGAGVKFKTITAMLWGLPIVTTDVGAEGIGDARLFVGLTNDAQEFAASLADALVAPERYAECVKNSFEWAQSKYSLEAFRTTLEEIVDGGRKVSHCDG